jgi:hypothetical protein
MEISWPLIALVLLVVSFIALLAAKSRGSRAGRHIPDHIADMEKRFVDA